MDTKEQCYEHLRQNYGNIYSTVSYLGTNKLYHFYNKLIPIKLIKKFLSTNESHTLMSEERKSKIFDVTWAIRPNDVYQFDLVDVTEMSNQNDGVKYLVCAIDCFSRVAHVEPVESKEAQQVSRAMIEIIYRYGYKPNVAAMDRGSEFVNVTVKTMLRKMKIKAIYAIGNYKCSMVERFQRTLERLIYAFITQKQNLRYIAHLQELLRNYNSSYHRGLGMDPFSAEKLENKSKVVQHMLKYRSKQRIKKLPATFDVGDVVRISYKKSPFHRSYNNQRTEQRYVINRVCTKHVTPCYFLANQKGDVMVDRFYQHELILTNIPTYRSSVKKSKNIRGKKHHLLSYQGYSSDFDEWVPDHETSLISDMQ